MAKPTVRSSKGRTRRRQVSASVKQLRERLEEILKEAEDRLGRAGNLQGAIEGGMGALAEAIEMLRRAGPAADELYTLCGVVDGRAAAMQSQTDDTPARRPVRETGGSGS